MPKIQRSQRRCTPFKKRQRGDEPERVEIRRLTLPETRRKKNENPPKQEDIEEIIDLRNASPILTVDSEIVGVAGEHKSTLDTGAGRPLINSGLVSNHRASDRNYRVIAADGNTLAVKGIKTIEVIFFGALFEVECLVVSGLDCSLILGESFLIEYGFDINHSNGTITFPILDQRVTVSMPGWQPPAQRKSARPAASRRQVNAPIAASSPPAAGTSARESPHAAASATASAGADAADGVAASSTGSDTEIKTPTQRVADSSATPPHAEPETETDSKAAPRRKHRRRHRHKNDVTLRAREWVTLGPKEECAVPFMPTPLQEECFIVPSTKWHHRKIEIITYILPEGETCVIMKNNKKTAQHLHPAEVIGTAKPTSEGAEQILCRRITTENPIKEISYGKQLSNEQRNKFNQIFEKRKKLFENTEEIPAVKDFEYEIFTPLELSPVVSKPIRLSEDKEEILVKKAEELIRAGVLEEACSPFSARAFVIPKKNKEYRFITDFSAIAAKLPADPFPVASLETARSILADAAIITSFDIKNAFFTIPISEKSRDLTAFTISTKTVRKQLRFRRLPMGWPHSSQALARFFHKIMADLLADGRVVAYADDFYCVSKDGDMEAHLQLDQVLGRFEEYNVRLSPDQVFAGFNKLTSLGYTFTCPGIEVEDSKIRALKDLPLPDTWSKLRSMYGLLVFFKPFIKSFDDHVAPIVDLLKPQHKFRRPFLTPEAAEAIGKFKKILTSAPILEPYRDGDQVCVAADASTVAVSYHIFQIRKESGKMATLCFGSQKLKETERKTLSVNILEMMAIALAIEKNPYYFKNHVVHCITDHKGILAASRYTSSSTKVNRLLSILSSYSLIFHHAKSAQNSVCDHLSRYPADDPPDQESISEFLQVYKTQLQDETPLRDKIREAQATDQDCNELRKFLQDNILPEDKRKAAKLKATRKYYAIHQDIVCHSFKNNVGDQVWTMITPPSVRKEILEWAHDNHAHPGQSETYRNAREIAYWKEIHHDVRNYTRSCKACNKVKRAYGQPAGHLHPRLAQSPFEMISLDWIGPLPITSGHRYEYCLVVQDVFTSWIEIYMATQATAKKAISLLENEFFSRYKYPKFIISDNHNMFNSPLWKEACAAWGAEAITTPSHTQRANRVERRNQDFKVLLRLSLLDQPHSTWDRQVPRILRHLRNRVSSTTGYSPAQLVLGHSLNPPHDPQLVLSTSEELNINQWAELRAEKLQAMTEIASQRIEEKLKKYLERPNATRNANVSYSLGQQVWARNRPQSDKAKKFCMSLAPKYKGPMEIIKKLSNEVFIIEDENHQQFKVHIQDLKPAYLPDGSRATAAPTPPRAAAEA